MSNGRQRLNGKLPDQRMTWGRPMSVVEKGLATPIVLLSVTPVAGLDQEMVLTFLSHEITYK